MFPASFESFALDPRPVTGAGWRPDRPPVAPVRYRSQAMVVWEALDALSHEFELCGLDATTRVVALFDADADDDRVALVRAALARVGADAVEVRSVHSQRRVSSIDEPGLLAAMVATADVVVDGRSSAMTGSGALSDGAVASSVARVLTLGAGSGRPQDFPPHANSVRRVNSLASSLSYASRFVIRDDSGTALEVTVDDGLVEYDHGIIEVSAAPRATYPAGWVRLTPGRDAVDGDLVMMPGDAIPAGRRLISSPVRLRIDHDRVTSIEGESSDADALRALLEQADDTNGYAIASISCGMNPPSDPLEQFDPRLLDLDIARLTAGIVCVGFGENLVAGRPCRQTVTIAMPGRTVEFDGVAVVHRGVLQGDLAPDVYETRG